MLRLRSTMLAAALAGAAPLAQAQDGDASWTFDTYTPGVCSANGGKHGGCPAGELVRIHVVTVADGLVRPEDITATLFHCLGTGAHAEIHDAQGRPLAVSTGQVLHPILA